MKKLVVKTACLSLAFLIGSMICAFGLATILAPGKVGVLFDGVGEYSASVFFYEKQYQKTQSVNDLYVLASNLDVYSDSVRAEKYYGKLISHNKFDDLCARIDEQNFDEQNKGVGTKDFCYGSLCIAFAENNKVSAAQSLVEMIEHDSWKNTIMEYLEQKTID